MIALGEKTAGLFGNSNDLQKSLEKAGQEVEERTWIVFVLSFIFIFRNLTIVL
jgi:leucyl aminopeptidase